MKNILFTLVLVLVLTSLADAQFGIKAGLYGGATIPTGDFNDLYNSQFSSEFAVYYPINKNLEISASFGYMRFVFDNDYLNNKLKDIFRQNFPGETAPSVNVNSNFTSTPIMIGIRYFMLNKGPVLPYAMLQLGLHIASFETISGIIVDSASGNSVTIPKSSKNETKFGSSLGIGVVVPVMDIIDIDGNFFINTMGVEFEQSYNITRGGTTISEGSKSNGMYFTAKLGFTIRL